jgi:hypothetical protein
VFDFGLTPEQVSSLYSLDVGTVTDATAGACVDPCVYREDRVGQAIGDSCRPPGIVRRSMRERPAPRPAGLRTSIASEWSARNG